MSAAILRLFVALYPPPATSQRLIDTLDALPLPRAGRARGDRIHLTLQFIGDTPARYLPDVEESVRRAAAGIGPFDLHPQRLVTLPEGPRPRLVAAQTDAPAALLEVQRRLVQRLARKPHGRSNDRFRPHLTLQRFKAPTPPVDLPIDIAPFRVAEVHLVQSILRPAGAEHRAIARIPFE